MGDCLKLHLRETVQPSNAGKIVPGDIGFNTVSIGLIKVNRRGLCSQAGEQPKMIGM